ncbi:MAG: DUF3800 domain-containing protein [Gammaproteobacteria bacterium]|nr:DUF3800 domain-containing protein [Gammaproteobacteria bacterium]
MEMYNVYCDESCHLENDRQPIMALGAIWCPKEELPRLSQEILDIKNKHNAKGELKWIKVSSSRKDFYFDLINWFFAEPAMHFRALVVLNKLSLDHKSFNQNSHDAFYYKMYFSLLNKLFSPEHKYDVYLDIKDTRSRLRNRKLKEILCNNVYDFTGEMIGKIQNIRSHESHLVQLTDLFLGALTYKHRNLAGNAAKLEIIKLIEAKLKYPSTLMRSTSLREEKFNLFLFSPQIPAPVQKRD